MGGNMVENLQTRGFTVNVMDLNKDAIAKVIARGNATEAVSAKELAEKSDIVMLALTTSVVVEKVVYADDGILAGIKEGSVLIDFGTSIPASTRKIGADLAKKGAGMIDAPLGRTPAHAKDGLLNIMSAGPSNSPFMQFCKFYAVDGEEKLGFSVANANKDLGYFNQMVANLGSESLIAQGTSANLQAAVDAGLGQNDVPVIFDYFKKLEK